MGLLVAARHQGWAFQKPSIIWHLLNFSSLTPTTQQEGPSASGISDYGPFSKNIRSEPFNLPSLPILFPLCATQGKQALSVLVEPDRAVSSTFTVIFWTTYFRSDSLWVYIVGSSGKTRVLWRRVFSIKFGMNMKYFRCKASKHHFQNFSVPCTLWMFY